MKRIVLTFGLISGAISAAMMFLTLPLIHRGVIDHENGLIVGYTSIFLAFLLVFFGIRAYRDQHGGTISFGRACAVGLLITLISSLCYVAAWEVLYYNFLPDFVDKMSAATINSMRAKGATDAMLAKKQVEMVELKKMLDNPLTNGLMTFIEPFPVGVVMTLVSAGILRRRATPVPASSSTAMV
ncbi:MAG: DUF4199 domain-containing protein [Acidobacteriota bacterium]|nr:DUF4199 domain-containing protein [Acidobacteriota bacterium]